MGQGSRRIQIVMVSALWKKHPNSYTHMKGFNMIKFDGIGYGKPHVHKKFRFLYGNSPIIGQGRLTRQGSRRVQIVMTSALWNKDPNSYTHMKGFNLIKFYGKPHIQKKIKFYMEMHP